MIAKNARFCFNNFLYDGNDTFTASASNYPHSNIFDDVRSKYWKPLGTYEITATNNKVRISGTTYSVAVGSYSQAQLITAFNAATGKTLQKDGFGLWQIITGASETLEFSFATDPILPVLGFLSTTDETGTTFTADEPVYSTGEWAKCDLGISQSLTFAAVIGPSGEVFSASEAEIRLQGNNVDVWSSPLVDEPMIVTDAGAFLAPDDLPSCRYWRVLIKDYKNNDIRISAIYMGSSVVTDATNLQTGFTRSYDDLSAKVYSESGQVWIDKRPKVLTLQSCGVQFLKGDDLRVVEQLMYDLGNSGNFFIVIDPKQEVSTSIDQMTHYVQVDGQIQFQHVINSYYNLSFNLREVL